MVQEAEIYNSEIFQQFFNPRVPTYILPGGRLPERQTDGAIGYDAYARAIVSPRLMDPKNPNFRLTLFNFQTLPEHPHMAKQVVEVPKENGDGIELAYRLKPGESILVGIGFATAMPFPLFYWTSPRSGLASKEGITVQNAPGTVDPDYRGEAGVLLFNRDNPDFKVTHHMRIAQGIFQWAVTPTFVIVESHNKLSSTIRGSGGFGSTGDR